MLTLQLILNATPPGMCRDKSLPRPLSSMLAAQSDVSSSQHHDVDYDEVIASRSMAPAIHQRADAKPAMARSNPPAMQVMPIPRLA